MAGRYAVYFAPERDGGLARLGNRWLGRCPETGERFTCPELAGLSGGKVRSLTEVPRHYGFHATLMPPFPLRNGLEEDDLMAWAARFSAGRKAFGLGPLSVREIGHFVALVPDVPNGVSGLADDCVRTFHPLREPPEPAELERRRAKGLTPPQERNLARWGYPYVFGEFRFHLTLTDFIPDGGLRRELAEGLAELFAPVLDTAHPVRELCIFHQPYEKADFRLTHRIPFGG